MHQCPPQACEKDIKHGDRDGGALNQENGASVREIEFECSMFVL